MQNTSLMSPHFDAQFIWCTGSDRGIPEPPIEIQITRPRTPRDRLMKGVSVPFAALSPSQQPVSRVRTLPDRASTQEMSEGSTSRAIIRTRPERPDIGRSWKAPRSLGLKSLQTPTIVDYLELQNVSYGLRRISDPQGESLPTQAYQTRRGQPSPRAQRLALRPKGPSKIRSRR